MDVPGELRVLLLGPPRIERAGETVVVARQKSIALVALLALAARPEPRQALASMLWPSLEVRRAGAALRSALWDLREAAGAEIAAVDGRSLVLRDQAVWVDAVELRRVRQAARVLSADSPREAAEHHERALALLRGDFLEGFSLAGHDEFEAWRSAQIERLRAAELDSLSEAIDLWTRAGNGDRAQIQAERLVAAFPSASSSHLRLMRVLVERGDRAGALEQYAACVRVLAAHKLTPDDATRALYESLRGRPAKAAAPGSPPRQDRGAPPLPPTLLVGRDAELAALLARLRDPSCRILTLTGQGGVGKTRLLLELGRSLQEQHPGEVRFVPLGAVTSSAHLATAIAAAAGIPQVGAGSGELELVEGLRDRTMFLLLDGFEHLLAGAPLLAEVVARAPGVRVVATSRERLHLRAEWSIAIDGLPFAPDPESPWRRPPAAELFWACASRVDPTVTPSAEHERGVLEVCRLLGGTPLAIELAAACVRRYSPAEMARKIEHDLDFLAAPRDAPLSQRSLRATFRHSWDLLSEDERAALRRLSILRGAFTEEAAASVAGASDAVLGALSEKFLVRRAGQGRVELHPLVRKFAADELALAGELDATRSAHARFFLGRCAVLQPDSPGPEQASVSGELHAARDDVLAAWSFGVSGHEFALLSRALYGFIRAYTVHGRFREADRVLGDTATAVRAAGDRKRRGRREVRTLLGRVLCFQGRIGLELRSREEVARTLSEGLRILRRTTATIDLCFGLNAAGRLAYREGEHEVARARFREALALCKREGDRRGTAIAYNNLSVIAIAVGDYERAERLLRRSIEVFRAIDDRASIASSLSSLGDLLIMKADLRGAEAALHEGLEILPEGGEPYVQAMLLAYLGEALLAAGALDDAERRLREARRIGQALEHDEIQATVDLGLALLAIQRAQIEEAERSARAALDAWTRLRSRPGMAEARRVLGTIAGRRGRARDAREHLLASLRIAQEIRQVPLVLDALVTISEQRAFGEAHARNVAGIVRAHTRAPASVRARAERLLAGFAGRAEDPSRAHEDLGGLVRAMLDVA